MKGVSEDLPAILFVVILIVVFLISILYSYGNYFNSINLIQQQRIASSIVEKVAFENKIVSDPPALLKSFDLNGIFLNITNTGNGTSWSSTRTFLQSRVVSSAAILIYDDSTKKLFPGRIEAYVGS